MNRTLAICMLVGSLLLIDAPDASAHERIRHAEPQHGWHHGAAHRAERMPRWMRHDHGFVVWYRHTPLRHNRHVGWYELFDIYRFEVAAAWNRRHHDQGRRYDGRYDDDHRHDSHRRRKH